MLRLRARSLLAAMSLTSALAAQAGNEYVFVGSSTSGSTDMHAVASSSPAGLVYSGPSSFTDNVTDAVWVDAGRTLYAGQSLQNRVVVGDWNGFTMAWSQLYAAPGACYGIGFDSGRKRVWTLVSSQTAGTELHCIDADPASASYGTKLAQTTTLSGPIRERWTLAPSGDFAVVPYGTVNSGPFQIVDTNPTSPTFLQVLVSAPMPAAVQAGFSFAFDCKVSLDEQYCYVLYAGVGFSSLAVFHRATNGFLDFDPVSPGQQDLALFVGAANSLAVSLDRAFALVSSQAAPGRVLRVDIDYVAPFQSTVTQFTALSVANANAVSLSPDGARGAVTSTAQTVGGPGKLVLFDAALGVELATVPLGNMWNLYTTAWQDISPNGVFASFGTGCPGLLGEPTLAGVRPRLGGTFAVTAAALPYDLAVLAVGFSNASSAGLPLPLPLAGVGMTGCNLLVDPLATAGVAGVGGSAVYNLPIPNNSQLFGFKVYFQSFPLDPFANAFGFTASHGGEATIGL